MTNEEIDAVAARLCSMLQEHRKDFWIEPEEHYNDHKELSDLIKDWKAAKTIFWKAFIGLAVIGSIALAAVGLGHKL